MKKLCFVLCLFLFHSAVSGAEILQKEITFSLPFASETEAERGYVDLPIADSSIIGKTGVVEIELECDKPEAVGNMTLYFHSGNGWYDFPVAYSPYELQEKNVLHLEVVVRSKNFRIEGTPNSLNQSDKIRFAIWRGNAADATVKLRRIRAVPYSILALLSNENENGTVNSLVTKMNQLGLSTGTVSQDELNEQRLSDCKIIVLPLNSQLSPQTVTTLKTFVERGGKLVAFYLLPPELMKTLGFESKQWLKSPGGDAAFAKIYFEELEPFENLNAISQKSWNINTALPIPENPYHAEVAAWWYDAAGRKTNYPALLISERGAFFSHILLFDEDSENKNQFLITLFGHFDPAFLYRNIIKSWKSIFNVGDPRNRTDEQRNELTKTQFDILKSYGFDLKPEFFQSNIDETTIQKFAPRFQELSETLNMMRQTMIENYCDSVFGQTPEFRAWWEHAGLGAYPGDWDRTMKELSESGFNAVISNLLWGASANYASDVIPRSKKFEQYGDQVEQAIQAGKKYGVEVHAWQVCWRLSGSPREFIEEMKKAGRTQKSSGGESGDWLCPSHPDNLDLECRTLCELVRKYPDLAGIHFDYIRYPDGDHCYCDGCRERFIKETGCLIQNFPKDVRSGGIYQQQYEQWRCDNITKLVERVHREAKKIRPNIKISAAVFSNYPSCRRGIGQDWGLWVEKGYLDFICPMDYTENLNHFESLIKRQKEIVADKIPLYPGIGATATGIAMTPDRVAAEIQITRNQNTSGFVIFNLNEKTIQAIPPMMKLGVTK